MMAATNVVDDYARQVVDGAVPAGKFHRLACVRHLRDRARENTSAFPYRFDIARAERFFKFAQMLKHYKGEWAGTPIVLQPHQKFRWGSVFGWVHIATGLRRFRHAFNLLPRKQGKSLEAAVVSLYVTFYDGEPGAEGYCAATKRDQAKLVFNDAKKLVNSSGLKSRINVQVSNLHRDSTDSKLAPLGADADSTDGLNPNFINIDEYQAHKTRGLIDVLETALGARRQPVINKIGTAGDNPVSPCGDEYDYACKVLDNVLVDESYFAFIAHADAEDDWQDERTWIKANPNWNFSIKPDDMRSLALKAKGIPSAAATFKQKRLNLWVNAANPCLGVDGWRKGQTICATKADEARWLEELLHDPCFVGIDLASKIDLMALSFVFPPRAGRRRWRLLQYLWTPEETLKDRAHRDRAPYDVWVAQGHLRTTPGTNLDHQVIREVLRENRERFDIERIGFDPWHADTLITQLITDDGFDETQVLAVPQTYQGMSSACLKFQAEILAGAVDARGCPVTAWAVSNTVGQSDNKGNLMFTKAKSRGRIDPVIAPTIGVSLALRQPSDGDSAYADHELVIV